MRLVVTSLLIKKFFGGGGKGAGKGKEHVTWYCSSCVFSCFCVGYGLAVREEGGGIEVWM